MKSMLGKGNCLTLVCVFILSTIALAEDAALIQNAKPGLELKKIELPKNPDGSRRLRLFLQPQARCNFGDLDAISSDLRELGEDAELQVSAETLGTAKPDVFYGVAEGKGDSAGYSINLPEFKKPTVLGIYLCSAAKSGPKMPCSQKRVQNYSEIFAPYKIDLKHTAHNGKYLGAAPAIKVDRQSISERVYFFRFMVAANGSVEFPDKPMSKNRYEQLVTKMKNSGANVADYGVLSEQLAKLGSMLGSEPFNSKNSNVLITLPYYDKKKCVG